MHRRALLLGLGGLGCIGLDGAPSPTLGPERVETLAEQVDGHPREALLFVPAGLSEPAPLVLVVHGSKGSAETMMTANGWRAALTERGWIGVFPRTGHGAAREHDGDGDTTFLLRLLDRVAAEVPVDTKRVFATGFSGGARSVYLLAAKHGGRLCAIGCSSGVIGMKEDPQGLSDPRANRVPPLSVLHVHGGRDSKVKLEGGPQTAMDGTVRTILPAKEAMARWIDLLGAEEQPDAPLGLGPGRLRARRWKAPSGRGVMMVVDPEMGHEWGKDWETALMCRFFEGAGCG
jgi:polyhydroxybutyrate depolymerase